MQRNNVNRNHGGSLIQIISDKSSIKGKVMGKSTLYFTSDFKKKEIENKSRLCILYEKGMNRCKTGHHQPYEKPTEEKWMINTL